MAFSRGLQRLNRNGFLLSTYRAHPMVFRDTLCKSLAVRTLCCSSNCSPASLCTRQTRSPSWQYLIVRRMSFGGNTELSAVEAELDRVNQGKENRSEVKNKQLLLFKALTQDISEPTIGLIAKLNSDAKLSAEEVYMLGVAVFEAKNHANEVDYLMKLAANLFGYSGEQGDHNASYTYAQLLRTGQGVEVNLSKAAELLNDLSLKGHPYAQFALGGMYYSGSGVEQSFKKAYTLYKVSMQNFVPQACNILGNMHQHGQGVEEDMKIAVDYYRKGCEMNDPLAYISLAHCYTLGKGVEISMEKAFENYFEASKSNNPLALYNVATHYFAGQGVEQNLTEAAEYYTKASSLGFYPAQVNLGNMYYGGVGVAKDKARAKELFELAAEKDEQAKKFLEIMKKEET